MRLSRQKCFPLLLVATIACGDTTAPVRLPATFDLVNVNGQQVPAPFTPASSAVPTILSAYLILGTDGHALMSERRRESDGSLSIVTNTFGYAISGNAIEIGSFSTCPANANCMGTFSGTISNDALSLVIASFPNDTKIVYNYRRTVGIPAD